MPFYGNPNVTITAINVSGGIVCSRTSGQTPCFVQVSASGITATGTSVPYEDLDFSWDFGDPSGTEIFTNPGVGGGEVNANNGQLGPEAAYVYRASGTYTITLTARGRNGTSITTQTVTQNVVVATFAPDANREFWFDSVNGNDSNNGLSAAAPKQSLSAMNTLLDHLPNTAIHIARGSIYDGSVTLNIWPNSSGSVTSGLRIDDRASVSSNLPYGSGSIPEFNISSGTSDVMAIKNGGSSSPQPKSDIVFTNIKFNKSGTATGSEVVSVTTSGNATTGTLANIYFDGCVNNNDTLSGGNGWNCNDSTNLLWTGGGLWNCTTSAPTALVNNAAMGFFGGSANWFFFVGGSWVGSTVSGSFTLEHHIYPDIQTHFLGQWINFGTGTNRNYCINTNNASGPSGTPVISQYTCFSQNNFSGVQRAHDLGNASNDVTKTQFKNVVCQLNNINNLTADGVILFSCGVSYTHRYNYVWGCNGGRYYAPDVLQLGSLLVSRVYGNKIYKDSSAVGGDLLSFASASWTQLQTITDNMTVDLRSSAQAIALPFSQQAGAVIDRNQYYAPGSTNFARDVTTSKSFAQLQAAGFDGAGQVNNPNWPSPSTGNFGTKRRITLET